MEREIPRSFVFCLRAALDDFFGFPPKNAKGLKISHPFEKRRVKDGCERRALDDSSSKCR